MGKPYKECIFAKHQYHLFAKYETRVQYLQLYDPFEIQYYCKKLKIKRNGN